MQNHWCSFIQAWYLNLRVLGAPRGLNIILSVDRMHSCIVVHGHLRKCWGRGRSLPLSNRYLPTSQPGGLYDNLFKGIADAEAEGNIDKLWAQREACISRIFADYLVSRYTDFNHFCMANCITVVAHHDSQLWGKLSLSSLWVWSREVLWITIV